MKYLVPDEWTEEMLVNLPDEDDRYEYKSGLLVDQFKSIDSKGKSLEESLSKEIGALVNSFGGTLFIGVKDKSKEIDGCPTIIKGKETTKEWLEKVIPGWFDFRLYSFRVNYVRLSDITRAKIGSDREVIHIDLMDSGYIPHQTKYDQRYYYREGSQSVVAPHHYLAYVHGAKSSTMSETVRKWCVEFLNPTIEYLRNAHLSLKHKTFKSVKKEIQSGIFLVPDISFFDPIKWLDMWSDGNLAGKQFFFTFPAERKKFEHLLELSMDLERKCRGLFKTIADSPLVEESCRTRLLARYGNTPGYVLPQERDVLMHELAGEFGLDLANAGKHSASREFTQLLGKMSVWHLLNIAALVDAEFNTIYSFSENLSKDIIVDEEIIKQVGAVNDCFERVNSEVKVLLDDLDLQRDQLAATHNTSYF